MHSSKGSLPELEPAKLRAAEPATILLVYDCATWRDAARAHFDAEAFTTLDANSLNAALETARLASLNLIVCDRMIADLDPGALCQRLQADPYTADVPLLLLTAATGDEQAVIEAIEAGAAECLPLHAPTALVRKKAARLIAQHQETRARRVAEAKYRDLIETLPAIVYVADAEPPYTTTYVSSKTAMLGYTPDEWYRRPDMWLSLLHPDDAARVMRETEAARAAGQEAEYEYRMIARDGAVHWFHDKGRFVFDKDGRALCGQGVMIDITERKRMEEALRRHEERFRLLIENSYDIVTILERDGTIRYESPSIERLVGYRPEALIGRSVFEFIHPDDLQSVLVAL